MHALWTGALSFGLVNIPVRVFSATQENSLDLDMLHKKDHAPVRYARVCKAEEEEIPYEEIVKGYKYKKGEYVVLTDEDFKRANVEKSETIAIDSFTDIANIGAVYFEKPYYLEPEKSAQKIYVLLREVLKKSNKVGIARFVFHQREHLAAIQSQGDILVLYQMRFADEIRGYDNLSIPKTADINAKEMGMAYALIEQLTEPFQPEKYHDTYIEDLKQLIQNKIKGQLPKVEPKPAKKMAEVHDIMALLQASLEAQGSGKASAQPGTSRKKSASTRRRKSA